MHRQVFRVAGVFNVLVYNNDDHPRNTGFLYVGKGFWRLSPLYDVVPAFVHTSTFKLAMEVGARGKEAGIENALSRCERFRLTLREARRHVNVLRKAVARWREHFARCGLTVAEIAQLEVAMSDKA